MIDLHDEQIRELNDALLVAAYRRLLVCSRNDPGDVRGALRAEIDRRGIDLDSFNGATGFGAPIGTRNRNRKTPFHRAARFLLSLLRR